MTRVVEVAPERWASWRERFDQRNPDGPQRVVTVEHFDHDPLALLLVRRGGYAVGTATGAHLTAHKTGTRYVQSRTAAGGWSQQRYARRRAHQADELVEAVVTHAARVLLDLPGPLPPRRGRDRSTDHAVGAGAGEGGGAAGLVVGGDRSLVGQVLDDPRLHPLRALPRRELWDLPDPRLAVLRTALERARAVRVTLDDG